MKQVFNVVAVLLFSFGLPKLFPMMAPELYPDVPERRKVSCLFSHTIYWNEPGFRFQDCCDVSLGYPHMALARPSNRSICFFDFSKPRKFKHDQRGLFGPTNTSWEVPLKGEPHSIAWNCQGPLGYRKKNLLKMLSIVCKGENGNYIAFYITSIKRFLYKKILREITYFEWCATVPGIFAVGDSESLSFFDIMTHEKKLLEKFSLDQTDKPITSIGRSRGRFLSYCKRKGSLTAWKFAGGKRLGNVEVEENTLFRFCQPDGSFFATILGSTLITYEYRLKKNPQKEVYKSPILSNVKDFLLQRFRVGQRKHSILMVALLGKNTLCFLNLTKERMVYFNEILKKALNLDAIFKGKRIISFRFFQDNPYTFVVMTQSCKYPNYYEVSVYDISDFLGEFL